MATALAHVIDNAAQSKVARVPLAHRRASLIQFLTDRGVATRAEILAHTGIPAGTLSALLVGPEFESTEHGWWRLKMPHEPEMDSE